jgi:hypothetical protein
VRRARNPINRAYSPARVDQDDLVEIYDFLFLHWEHLTIEYNDYQLDTREELLSIPSSISSKIWFFAQRSREPDDNASTNVRLSIESGHGSVTIDNDQHAPSLRFLSMCEEAFRKTSSVVNPVLSFPMPTTQVSAEPTSSSVIPLTPTAANITPVSSNNAHGGGFWKPVWQHVMAHLIWWILGVIALGVSGYLGIANLIPKH